MDTLRHRAGIGTSQQNSWAAGSFCEVHSTRRNSKTSSSTTSSQTTASGNRVDMNSDQRGHPTQNTTRGLNATSQPPRSHDHHAPSPRRGLRLTPHSEKTRNSHTQHKPQQAGTQTNKRNRPNNIIWSIQEVEECRTCQEEKVSRITSTKQDSPESMKHNIDETMLCSIVSASRPATFRATHGRQMHALTSSIYLLSEEKLRLTERNRSGHKSAKRPKARFAASEDPRTPSEPSQEEEHLITHTQDTQRAKPT